MTDSDLDKDNDRLTVGCSLYTSGELPDGGPCFLAIVCVNGSRIWLGLSKIGRACSDSIRREFHVRIFKGLDSSPLFP